MAEAARLTPEQVEMVRRWAKRRFRRFWLFSLLMGPLILLGTAASISGFGSDWTQAILGLGWSLACILWLWGDWQAARCYSRVGPSSELITLRGKLEVRGYSARGGRYNCIHGLRVEFADKGLLKGIPLGSRCTATALIETEPCLVVAIETTGTSPGKAGPGS